MSERAKTLAWSIRLAEPDNGRETPVEVPQSVRPEPLHFAQRNGGPGEQRLDVDALTPRGERGEVTRAARQHVHRPVMVPAPQMVERHANLKDALIEAAHVPLFGPPEQLEGFVLLEGTRRG